MGRTTPRSSTSRAGPYVSMSMEFVAMSKTHYIQYRGDGFWGYDVAQGILLKHLADLAEARAGEPGLSWLKGRPLVADRRCPLRALDRGILVCRTEGRLRRPCPPGV